MIKLIIFDMDGTLYDLNDVVQMSYRMQVDFLSMKKSIPRVEAINFLSQHHVYPVMKEDSRSATELFLQMGLDKREWSEYRDTRFDIEIINKDKAIDENTIRHFSNFGIVVLLSSNAFSVIEKVLSHINIKSSVFNKIICSDRFPYQEPFSKKRAMEFLSEEYCVKYNEMISIGDRYTTDILPMIELGGRGIKINAPNDIRGVLNDLSFNRL